MCETQTNNRTVDGLVQRFSNSSQGNNQETVFALYPYSYKGQDGREVSFEAGDNFTLIEKLDNGWWQVLNQYNDTVYVPANYVCLSTQTTDFGECETTESASEGETNTLSPSSEGSLHDYEENIDVNTANEEQATSFGKKNSEEVIYANFPSIVNQNEVSLLSMNKLGLFEHVKY